MDAHTIQSLLLENLTLADLYALPHCACCGAHWHLIEDCPILENPFQTWDGEKLGCIPTCEECMLSQIWCDLCFQAGHASENCSRNFFEIERKQFDNLAEELVEDLLNPAIDDMLDNDVVRGYIGTRVKRSQEFYSSIPHYVPVRVIESAGSGVTIIFERVSVGTCESEIKPQESQLLVDSPPAPKRTRPSNMFDDLLDFVIGKDTISFNMSMFTNLSFLKHIWGRKFFDDKWHTNCSQLLYGFTSSDLLCMNIFNDKLRALHRRVLKFLTPPRSRFKQ